MTSIETRLVGFLNWDSDEERERSQKGASSVSAEAEATKDGHAAARHSQCWGGVECFNRPVERRHHIRFCKEQPCIARVFFENFQSLFAAFRRSPLWGRLRNPRGPPYSICDMLHYLHISGVSFGELQQVDTEEFQFLIRLMTIGIIPDFGDRFVSRPAVSATDRGRQLAAAILAMKMRISTLLIGAVNAKNKQLFYL